MKHKNLFVLLMTAILIVALSISAFGYNEEKKATCFKAPDEVAIDGDLSDWNTSEPIVIKDKEQVVRDEGQWEGEEDLSLEVYFMWDADNLYVAANVKDDTPLMYREGFPPDMADSLVLFLSTDKDADPARESYTANDFRLTMCIDDYYFNTGIDRDMIEDNKGFETIGADGDEQILEGYDCVITETDDGYVFEAVIPWVNFSNEELPVLVPEKDMTIGFEAGMFDLDFPCPGVATARMQWAGDSMDVDVNPSLWGTLTFAE